MGAMVNLREMLCAEIDEFEHKNRLSMADLETVHKLTDTLKNLDKIEMMEEGGYAEDDGMYSQRRYSRDGDWTASGSYSRGNSYTRGRSMRGYAQRRGYSRDDAKTEILGQIEDLMATASGPMKEILAKTHSEIERI